MYRGDEDRSEQDDYRQNYGNPLQLPPQLPQIRNLASLQQQYETQQHFQQKGTPAPASLVQSTMYSPPTSLSSVGIFDELCRAARLPVDRPSNEDLRHIAGLLETVTSICELDSTTLSQIEKVCPAGNMRDRVKKVKVSRKAVEEEEMNENTVWEGQMAHNLQKIIEIRAEYVKQFITNPSFGREECIKILHEGFRLSSVPSERQADVFPDMIINIKNVANLQEFWQSDKIGAFYLFPSSNQQVYDEKKKMFDFYFKACEKRARKEVPKILTSQLAGKHDGLAAFILPLKVCFVQDFVEQEKLDPPADEKTLLLIIYRLPGCSGNIPFREDTGEVYVPPKIEKKPRPKRFNFLDFDESAVTNEILQSMEILG